MRHPKRSTVHFLRGSGGGENEAGVEPGPGLNAVARDDFRAGHRAGICHPETDGLPVLAYSEVRGLL
jgi:hypothetical protein